MNTDIAACIDCLAILKDHVHSHRLGPFTMECRRDRCHECEYKETFRRSRLVKKPYQDPFPRPDKDGRMPASLREDLAKVMEEKE